MLSVLKKRFDKSVARLSHKETVYSAIMFATEETGSDLSSSWAFLKRGMKIVPHRHPAKEIYFFVKGEGFIQIEQERSLVKAGEAVYIPPNVIHETWNEKEEDLEFICISFGLSPPSFLLRILSLLYRSLYGIIEKPKASKYVEE